MRKLFLYTVLSFSLLSFGQTIKFGTLGGGFTNQSYNAVRALFYDSVNNKLYAGGQFYEVEGKIVWGAAVWNGSKWDSLAGGFTQFPHVAPPSPNSAGPVINKIISYKGKIYFAGAFNYVNGKPNCCLAIWNGTTWETPLGQPPNGDILDMKVHNDTLYVCGRFTKFGNLTCNYVAKFGGTTWQPVGNMQKYFGTYTPAQVNAVEIFNNEVYVAGAWVDSALTDSRNIAKFNGNQWENVGTGIRQGGVNSVWALQEYKNKLYIGGYFDKTSEIPSPGFITWDGFTYGRGANYDLDGHGYVRAFTIYKGKLALLGNFKKYGPYEAVNLLFLDETKNCSITDIQSHLNDVNFSWGWNSFVAMKDTLVLGGQFDYIATLPAKNIATIVDYENQSNCTYTGLLENKSVAKFGIYPNPVLNELFITETNLNAVERIEIANILGETFCIVNFYPSLKSLDVSALESGIYQITFVSDSFRFTKKFVKVD